MTRKTDCGVRMSRDGVLAWNATEDSCHAYSRVYDAWRFSVKGVDQWGNVGK